MSRPAKHQQKFSLCDCVHLCAEIAKCVHRTRVAPCSGKPVLQVALYSQRLAVAASDATICMTQDDGGMTCFLVWCVFFVNKILRLNNASNNISPPGAPVQLVLLLRTRNASLSAFQLTWHYSSSSSCCNRVFSCTYMCETVSSTSAAVRTSYSCSNCCIDPATCSKTTYIATLQAAGHFIETEVWLMVFITGGWVTLGDGCRVFLYRFQLLMKQFEVVV